MWGQFGDLVVKHVATGHFWQQGRRTVTRWTRSKRRPSHVALWAAGVKSGGSKNRTGVVVVVFAQIYPETKNGRTRGSSTPTRRRAVKPEPEAVKPRPRVGAGESG